MLRIALHLVDRHLVGAPKALDPLAVDFLRAGPAFPRAKHDHRPGRTLREPAAPCVLLDALDVADDRFEGLGHQLMHRLRVVALDEMRRVAVAAKKTVELLVRNAREHRRVGDLVAVEVQDRQHRAVARGVEELVRMPARRQRSGLRLAVADHAGGDKAGIVEDRAMGVRHRIAELAALMNGPRRLRRHMARNPAGKRELNEETLHALFVPGNVRIDLAVGPFEISVGHHTWPAVAGTGDIDHVEVELLDQTVQVDVDEIEARRGAPMAEQARLDVVLRERDFQ